MLHAQTTLDADWAARDLAPFGLGIGLSTGPVAAALLGSEERLEYTLVGDTVNLAQRLQDLARPAGCVVVAEPTLAALDRVPAYDELGEQLVKGRQMPVRAYRIDGALSTTPGGTREHPSHRDPSACGRTSNPRVRPSARCGASTSR